MKLYNIFLPKKYNDGKEIEQAKIQKIVAEITEKFGAYSLDPHARLPVIQGVWTSDEDDKVYEDEIYLIELFIEDTFANKKWISVRRDLWRQELAQKELFVIVQDAEILT